MSPEAAYTPSGAWERQPKPVTIALPSKEQHHGVGFPGDPDWVLSLQFNLLQLIGVS